MAIPNTLPEWDTTEVNIVEVDQEHKDKGWLAPGGVPEKPPFQSFNWWQNLVYKWVLRFKNVTGGLDNLTELLSFPEAVDGTSVNVRGHTSKNDGGGDIFNYDSSIDKSTANGGTIIDPGQTLPNQGLGVGNGCWVRQDKSMIISKDFGLVGDGIVDDTIQFQKLLLAAEGKTITLVKGETYLVKDELQMPVNCNIIAYGAAINFDVPDSTYCLRLNHSCTVKGGAFRNKGTATGGDGRYHVPLIIGDIAGATGDGISNCIIEDVAVQQLNTNKANIAVMADSYNITIKNVKIEPSTTSPLGIMIHWGSENDLQAPGTVNHSYNILIDGVKSKGLKPTVKPAEGAVVFLSGCYNVEVKNIEVEDSYWSVRTQVGSAGNGNSNTSQKKRVLTGIKVSNVSSINVENPISAIWGGDDAGGNGKFFTNEADIVYENCNSYNDVIPTTESSSIQVAALSGVKIIKCTSENFYHGFSNSTSGGLNGTNNLTIKDCNFKELGHSGIIIDSDTLGLTKDVTIENCTIENFNQEESTATPRYVSGIYSAALNTSIVECKVNGNQGLYGVYLTTNCEDSYVDILTAYELHTTTASIVVKSLSDTNLANRVVNKTTNAITLSGLGSKYTGSFSATFDGNHFSATDNTTVIMPFDTTLINENGDFDNANYQYKPTEPGNYAITLQYVLRGIASQTLCRAMIYKNGSSYNATTYDTSNPSVSTNIGGSGTIIVPMNGTTDYIDARFYHNNGAAKDLDGSLKFGCILSGRKIN